MPQQKIIKFSSEHFLHEAEPAKPVPAPIGEIISRIQSRAVATDKGRAGIWVSSPGRWHRQIMQAEYCIFLAGECTFTPENDDPIEVLPGDVLYFPENSQGVWDIKTECRKAFFIFS